MLAEQGKWVRGLANGKNIDSRVNDTNRRPIAIIFRQTADRAVKFCIYCKIHPDVISWSSLLASIIAGFCFWQAQSWPALLLFGGGLCLVRLWFNMLDGMVAIAAEKTNPHGEIVNELPDRLSDLAIFVGIAHSGLCEPFIGYWAAISALLVAYVGTLSQAAGAGRTFNGIMSKPWRMVVVVIFALIAFCFFVSQTNQVFRCGFSLFDIGCLLVIAGCGQTIFVRLRASFKELWKNKGSDA